MQGPTTASYHCEALTYITKSISATLYEAPLRIRPACLRTNGLQERQASISYREEQAERNHVAMSSIRHHFDGLTSRKHQARIRTHNFYLRPLSSVVTSVSSSYLHCVDGVEKSLDEHVPWPPMAIDFHFSYRESRMMPRGFPRPILFCHPCLRWKMPLCLKNARQLHDAGAASSVLRSSWLECTLARVTSASICFA